MKLDETTGLKQCSKCKQALTPDNFSKDASTGDGYFHMCKPCASKKAKAFYYNNLESERERIAAYNQAHKDDPVWDAYNANAKNQKLQKLYGITLADFNYMWDKQGGMCGACGTQLLRQTGGHAVDHSHKTGQVRGLICFNCNVILGFADDNPQLLSNLASYLISTSTPKS